MLSEQTTASVESEVAKELVLGTDFRGWRPGYAHGARVRVDRWNYCAAARFEVVESAKAVVIVLGAVQIGAVVPLASGLDPPAPRFGRCDGTSRQTGAHRCCRRVLRIGHVAS